MVTKRRTTRKTTRKTTSRRTKRRTPARKTPKYVVTATVMLKSKQLSKTEADRLKTGVKRKSPNARVSVKKV